MASGSNASVLKKKNEIKGRLCSAPFFILPLLEPPQHRQNRCGPVALLLFLRQIGRQFSQMLLAGHRFDLVGQRDDALPLATQPTAQDIVVGSERLTPEGVRV
ncbi:hypothetical protein GGR43_004061 [Sphingobium jiangsuense]|uniref:Uncharacterized protein n=1 Tax=Sphingobium jiangsuense TaxID=870476 RepID=A0A7W6FS35_9SPHN|nr:hypothetical protein [Sphingobium jiangsuense]MBB3928317.1 hypothetical protein [Sphingobium jiangsuense]